jgi:hypothetical protein
MVLALAGMNAGFSMTIPIEKGNVWKYSYSSNYKMDTTLVDTSTGRLSLLIDSVATHSGQNDTTFFWLAIIDSGTINDSVSPDYQLNYRKHFYAYHDSLFSLDTFTSQGFKKELLFYYSMPQTSGSFGYGTNAMFYSQKTDSTTIMVGMQQFEAFSRVTDTTIRHLSTANFSTEKKNFIFQWINRIGTAYYSELRTNNRLIIDMTFHRTYTLESFNGMPIPPIPVTAIKADLSLPKSAIPMNAPGKIVYLKKTIPGLTISPTTAYFNLQGQKQYRPIAGGQLLLQVSRF